MLAKENPYSSCTLVVWACLSAILLLVAPARAEAAPPQQNFELHFYDGQVASVPLVQAEFPVSQLTLEAWLKPGKLVQDAFILGENILDQHPPFSSLTFLYATDQPGHIAFNLVTDEGGAYAASSSPLSIDEWSHVAVIYDGSEARFFVDGVLEVQVALTGSVVFDEGIFQIGGASYSSAVLYHNTVRQVRLWESARTQTQIIDAMDRTLSGTEVGLLHYWPLDDGSGQSARNLTGGPELTLGWTPDSEDTFDEPFWRLTDVYFEVDESAFPESGFLSKKELGTANGSTIIDLNADGIPDYFHCGSNHDPAVQVPTSCQFFLNDGMGWFTDATTSLMPDAPPAPVGNVWSLVADFNGDQRDDLFLINAGVDAREFEGEDDTLLVSQPDGTYRNVDDYAQARPCTASSPAFPGQHWCALVDDDTDTIKIYPAEEGWTKPPTAASAPSAAGDIDEDGDIDIYVSNHGTIGSKAMPYFLINDGQGHFTVNWEYVPDHYIWSSDSEDTSYPTIGISQVQTVSLVDLDGDGHLDLLGRGSGKFWPYAPNSAVYWGDGSGDYAKVPWTELPEPGDFRNHPGHSVTQDIDGDSDVDIVSPSATREYEGGYYQVLINHGDRTFSDETEQRLAGQTGEDETYNFHVVPADMNGDGCIDLVSSYEADTGNLYGSLIHLNNCGGSFSPIDNIVLGKPAKPMPLDADQDGDIDFISYRPGGVPGDFTRDWALLRQIRPFSSRPTSVRATDGAFSDRVRVTFNTVFGATVYRVFRCPDTGPNCGLPIGFPKTGTFDDTKGVTGTVYYYRVRACTTTICGKFSVANTGFSSAVPANPTGVTATDGAYVKRVQVTWNAVNDATSYRIYRCLDSGLNCGSPVGFRKTTVFNDLKGTPEQVYYYRVKACTTSTCGDFSVADTGYGAKEQDKPTAIKATDGTYPDRVEVSWNPVTDAVVYRVFRCLDKGQTCGSPIGFPKTTNFNDKKGDSGTVYYYRVRACTTTVCGLFSVANPGHRGG